MMIVSLFTILTISFCKKDENILTGDATVIDSGIVAADGCGWMVKINDTYYSPTNLPDTYKKTDTKVSISYHLLTTKFVCGIAASSYTQTDIKTIRNK